MNDSDTKQNETAAPIVAVGARTSGAAQPGNEAIRCLRESRVRFALLNADPEALQQQPVLEALVAPAEMEVAAAALRRAGYREMRRAGVAPACRTFLTYQVDRFVAVTLRHELRIHGVRILDAAIALARQDERAAVPRLAKEDRFLHLLLGAALAGSAPRPDACVQLVRLRRDRLDVELLALQTQRLGIRALVEQALATLDPLLREPARWRRFCWSVWLGMLRQPDVRRDLWQSWRSQRGSNHPVLVAIVGPPHAGKSALATTLAAQLEPSPLRARQVPMSCWQGGGLWGRCLRRLAPSALSLPRLWRARRGQSVRLTEVEREHLSVAKARWLPLAVGAAVQPLQTALFHVALLVTLRLRYARHIARCPAPIVLADGWVIDLAFERGLVPYQHGTHWRRFLARHFPAPDGIVYLSPSYELAASRHPALTRAQFDGVDLELRRLLRPLQPLEFVTDEAPRVVALTFLQRYWAHLLERYNRHV